MCRLIGYSFQTIALGALEMFLIRRVYMGLENVKILGEIDIFKGRADVQVKYRIIQQSSLYQRSMALWEED